MRRLIKNIEQVLYHEECVVVPGVGAFLRHDASATIDGSKGLIYPGHTDLSFNSAIQKNDGILVQQYMSAFSMGYKRAHSLLESDIREFRESLHQNGLIQVGSIGRLTLDRTEGRITFLPNSDHPYSINFYGLMPVTQLPEVVETSRVPNSTTARKSDIFYLPINLRTIRYGVAAAVFALAVLLIPTKRLSFPEGASQYRAGFLLPQKTEEAPHPISHETIQAAGPTLPSSDIAVAGLPVVIPEVGTPRYYVVIASLKSEKQVEKYVRQYQPAKYFSHSGILVTPSGMHRVFTGVYDSMEAAQADLNSQVIVHPDFASAWVYERK